jgi:hypothetical protein
MFETKEFYNILVRKDNFQRIAELSTAAMGESTKASKTCSLTVLNQILSHHIEKLKKKEASKDENKEANNDDDDMIVQQNSDDEFEYGDSRGSQTNCMVEVLVDQIVKL